MKVLFLDNENKCKKNLSLKDVGNNYGNLLFYFATLKLFKIHDLEFETCENPDVIVITTANCISNIQSNINYVSYLYNKVKQYNCHKILLSIGAQNSDLNLFELNTQARTNLNNLFSQMSLINLRGKYTYDLLNYNNIKYPYKIWGCPSICLCDPITFERRSLNKDSKILFNAPRRGQCNTEFFKNLYDSDDMAFLYQDSPWPKFYKKQKNHIMPSDYDDWKKIIKNYDFIVGCRIHGAIISLCLGIPTVLIVIDSRTYELANILKIPYINNINNKLNVNSKEELVSIINNKLLELESFNINLYKKKAQFEIKLFEHINKFS